VISQLKGFKTRVSKEKNPLLLRINILKFVTESPLEKWDRFNHYQVPSIEALINNSH